MTDNRTPIRIYDRDTLALYAQVSVYESAYFTRSWSGCGDFEIVINFNIFDNLGASYASYFQRGRVVQFGTDPRDTGIITEVTMPVDEGGKGSQKWTIKGYELKWFLMLRKVLPQTGFANYTVTGLGEAVIKAAVLAQFNGSSDTARQTTMMVIGTNLNRGTLSYSMSACGTSLFDEIQKVSLATLVGYWIYIDFTALKYTLECGVGLDRTSGNGVNAPVVFSPQLRTLRSATVTDSEASFRNVVYASGAIGGSAKTIRKVFNSTEPTGLNRREDFLNINTAASTADIDTQGFAKLADVQYALQFDAQGLASCQFVYQVDYDLGDFVTLMTPDVSKNAQITQVRESYASNKYEIDFVFDKAPPTIGGQMTAHAAVLSNLAAQSPGAGWTPYPAGTYSFPSGNQVVATPGILPIGSTVAAGAPTFGTGATLKAWYRDNGKTIDIWIQIIQTTAAGAAAGNGNYLIPLPLGKQFDSNVSMASNAYDGQYIGGGSMRALQAGTGYMAAISLVAATTTAMVAVGPYVTSASTATLTEWCNVSFQPSGLTALTFGAIIVGIPVQ